MKSKLLLFFAFIFISVIAFGQENKLNKKQIQEIKQLVNVFKTRDKAKIADHITYPLRREYPLKDVKNKNDFIQRFNELFDKDFIDHVARSKMADWAQVGWRGIMLDDGALWINDDGMITAVNTQSTKEKQMLKEAIQSDKNQLPKSLQNFIRPTYLIFTKSFKIRIDEIKDNKFRYAAWKIKDQKIEPDLILEDGELEFDGSGGNHTITFKKNGYSYIVAINVIGEEKSPDATLEVQKDEKTILEENGKIKRN